MSEMEMSTIHGSDARLSPAHFSPEVTMHHNLNNMTRDAVLTSDSIVGVPDTISVFFLPQSDLFTRESGHKRHK
jgi:hypothetical protein